MLSSNIITVVINVVVGTHHLRNKHEALRQLHGWRRTRNLACRFYRPKPGAVWWHLVQEQRSRAWFLRPNT
jgi:hypothetical protein